MAQEDLITPDRTPLLSVVIPTAGRPQWLARAIESALASAPGGNVEVIVVPNGPDTSWKEVLAPFSSDRRVRAEPIATAHANVARNHGMACASGKYIRFLDDDDYLLTPAALNQLQSLIDEGAECSSGLVRSEDINGRNLGLLTFPSDDDFVEASTVISGFLLPIGNVFKRDRLYGCRWNEQVHRAQDHVWMLHLAATREWHWLKFKQPVAVWFQHPQPRTSRSKKSLHSPNDMVNALVHLFEMLSQTDRMSSKRTSAIASALRQQVHRYFPFHPFYLSTIAKLATQLERKTLIGAHWVDSLLVIEWILLVPRRITTAIREGRGRIRGGDYRRRM